MLWLSRRLTSGKRNSLYLLSDTRCIGLFGCLDPFPLSNEGEVGSGHSAHPSRLPGSILDSRSKDL